LIVHKLLRFCRFAILCMIMNGVLPSAQDGMMI
jgi:hypothetical protein